jgi:hypothetical protein
VQVRIFLLLLMMPVRAQSLTGTHRHRLSEEAHTFLGRRVCG